MIKPILKIELPEGADQEALKGSYDSLSGSSITSEYHVIIVFGKSDYTRVEIITAADASIHKPCYTDDIPSQNV